MDIPAGTCFRAHIVFSQCTGRRSRCARERMVIRYVAMFYVCIYADTPTAAQTTYRSAEHLPQHAPPAAAHITYRSTDGTGISVLRQWVSVARGRAKVRSGYSTTARKGVLAAAGPQQVLLRIVESVVLRSALCSGVFPVPNVMLQLV